MLWTIFVILLILWALGLATGATLNGIHPYLTDHRNRRSVTTSHSRAPVGLGVQRAESGSGSWIHKNSAIAGVL